jgi:hypothetical protein
MMVDDMRAAGRDRWQQLLDEATEVRRARGQRQMKQAVRPQLARGLVQLAAWLDPAVKPARQTRRSA